MLALSTETIETLNIILIPIATWVMWWMISLASDMRDVKPRYYRTFKTKDKR